MYELLDEKLQHDCQEQTHQIVEKCSYVESGISFTLYHSYREVIQKTNSTTNNEALHKIFLKNDTVTYIIKAECPTTSPVRRHREKKTSRRRVSVRLAVAKKENSCDRCRIAGAVL